MDNENDNRIISIKIETIMITLIILIVALLPAYLLFMYIWKKDPQKEPTSKLLKAIAAGALICIPVAIIELIIHGVLFPTDRKSVV